MEVCGLILEENIQIVYTSFSIWYPDVQSSAKLLIKILKHKKWRGLCLFTDSFAGTRVDDCPLSLCNRPDIRVSITWINTESDATDS